RQFAACPTIATIRSAAEGGAWDAPDRARLELFQHVMPYVDAVDVELSSEAIVADVVDAARPAGAVVIVSHPDFVGTPPDAELDAIVGCARDAGADYVKVAAMATSSDDVRRLAAFTVRHAASGLIVIAMGDLGSVSRVFFPALGSRLTYAHRGEHPVAGQLDL